MNIFLVDFLNAALSYPGLPPRSIPPALPGLTLQTWKYFTSQFQLKIYFI